MASAEQVPSKRPLWGIRIKGCFRFFLEGWIEAYRLRSHSPFVSFVSVHEGVHFSVNHRNTVQNPLAWHTYMYKRGYRIMGLETWGASAYNQAQVQPAMRLRCNVDFAPFPPCGLIPRCWEWGLLGAYPILQANSYSDRSAITQVVVGSLIDYISICKQKRLRVDRYLR